MIKCRRVLLKLTGEALQGNGYNLDRVALEFLRNEIRSICDNTQLAIGIGGGNIARGQHLKDNLGIEQTFGDFMGMLATIYNGAAIDADLREKGGLSVRHMSAVDCPCLAERYHFKPARSHLDRGRIIILSGGTGNSGVTTDTAAVIRAGELNADIVMKGTKVDGVFDSDPKTNPNAQLLPRLTYHQFLTCGPDGRGLSGILDRSAITQAEMKKIPILVFNIFTPGNLAKAVSGEPIGSIISE